jgi:spore maturation protein CgeB
MARFGYCPSGRLFEAAASGVPIVSDWFDGLDQFFEPDRELMIARNTDDVLAALEESDSALARRAALARERVFAQHLASRRAEQLEELLVSAQSPADDRYVRTPAVP